MNLLKRSKSKVITETITHYTPSIILIFVKKPIYFSAYFNYCLVTICKQNPNISTCQVEWLINLMKEFCSKEYGVVTLMIDNIYAINLAKNLIAHGSSKHIYK